MDIKHLCLTTVSTIWLGSTSSNKTTNAKWTRSTSGPSEKGCQPGDTLVDALQSHTPQGKRIHIANEIITLTLLLLLRFSKTVRREVEFQQNKAAQVAKISRKHESRFDNETCTSDSSTEEDVKEASAAPEPDAGYTYSYDAPRGPGKGSQVLGIALAKAVEKFETMATEKLIKDEYDVVGSEKEETHAGYTADDDDFELV